MSRVVFFILAITFVLCVATYFAYQYFHEKDKRAYKREKEERERVDRMVDIAEDEYDDP